MENFFITKEIGNGSFANVYQAINQSTKDVIAIKRLKQKYQTMDQVLNLREIKFLLKINHPNIIKMKEIVKIKDELNLIFEILDMNLLQFYQTSYYDEDNIKLIIFQIASALAYMHKCGYFHRDLKPENILISENQVKLCDFGLAREIRSRPPFTEYVATRWYRAPEIILSAPNYNSPVDIFALGCIMAELFNKKPLIDGQSEIEQLNKTFQILGTPNQSQWLEGYKLASKKGIQIPVYEKKQLNNLIPSASQEAINVIQEMLQIDSQLRPSANQILQYSYFSQCASQLSKIDQIKIENQDKTFIKKLQNNEIQRKTSLHQSTQLNNFQNHQNFQNNFQKQQSVFQNVSNRNALKVNPVQSTFISNQQYQANNNQTTIFNKY